jgi:hypothetical protein
MRADIHGDGTFVLPRRNLPAEPFDRQITPHTFGGFGDIARNILCGRGNDKILGAMACTQRQERSRDERGAR